MEILILLGFAALVAMLVLRQLGETVESKFAGAEATIAGIGSGGEPGLGDGVAAGSGGLAPDGAGAADGAERSASGAPSRTRTAAGRTADLLSALLPASLTVREGAAPVDRTANARGQLGSGTERIGAGVIDGLGGALTNIAEGLTAIGSGLGSVATGDVAGGMATAALGLVQTTVQTAADFVLAAGGGVISGALVLAGLETPGQRLSDAEVAMLDRVFQGSVNYRSVTIKRVDVGDSDAAAFVNLNTIYMFHETEAMLVHEVVHIWQHQHGGTDYMTEAMWGQHFGDGYDWQVALDAGATWPELNPEQQAAFIQSAFEAGFFDNPQGRFEVDGTDYTDHLRDALDQLRAGRGAP